MSLVFDILPLGKLIYNSSHLKEGDYVGDVVWISDLDQHTFLDSLSVFYLILSISTEIYFKILYSRPC